MNIVYQKCNYEKALVDGNYQSSFFFALIDELNLAIENRLYIISAIGLLCGIEQAGREVLRFANPGKSYNSTDAFNYFLENYMNYGPLLKSYPKVYDTFRNGMAHEGSIKHEGDVLVGAGYSDQLLKELNVREGELRGLHATPTQAALTNDILLCEFLAGIKQFREDEIKNDWRY